MIVGRSKMKPDIHPAFFSSRRNFFPGTKTAQIGHVKMHLAAWMVQPQK
jgi:hypothetical protein